MSASYYEFANGVAGEPVQTMTPLTMYLLVVNEVIVMQVPTTPPVSAPFRLMKSLAAAGTKPAIAPDVSESIDRTEPINLSVPLVPILTEEVAIVASTQMVKVAPWLFKVFGSVPGPADAAEAEVLIAGSVMTRSEAKVPPTFKVLPA